MNQFSGKVLKTVLIFTFLIFGMNGCKDDYSSAIPYVYVYKKINLENQIDLNIPFGSIYLNYLGYGGIIILNNFGDYTYPYKAFDAACTYEVSSLIRVEVNENGGIIATCPKCKSQFNLADGIASPINGPAVEPLKQYHANLLNGQLLISN